VSVLFFCAGFIIGVFDHFYDESNAYEQGKYPDKNRFSRKNFEIQPFAAEGGKCK
jgi:hypothetical protein